MRSWISTAKGVGAVAVPRGRFRQACRNATVNGSLVALRCLASCSACRGDFVVVFSVVYAYVDDGDGGVYDDVDDDTLKL